MTVLGIWIVIGLPSLWTLRLALRRLWEFFTWNGLKYSLLYQPTAGLGLCLCIGVTVSTMLWQSYYEVFGLSPKFRRKLEAQVARIRQSGPQHWLWRWVVEPFLPGS